MSDISGDIFAHREDFETCPYCNRIQSHELWTENIIDIVENHFRFPHTGTVTAISECNSCFEKSWVHRKISYSYISTYSRLES